MSFRSSRALYGCSLARSFSDQCQFLQFNISGTDVEFDESESAGRERRGLLHAEIAAARCRTLLNSYGGRGSAMGL